MIQFQDNKFNSEQERILINIIVSINLNKLIRKKNQLILLGVI